MNNFVYLPEQKMKQSRQLKIQMLPNKGFLDPSRYVQGSYTKGGPSPSRIEKFMPTVQMEGS